MTLFRRLALTTTLLTLGTITVGGLVRATGSGDGCPNWPKCFDSFIPPLEYHALIEWSHRSIGFFAIVSLLSLALVAILKVRAHRSLFLPTMLATPSILMQAILGAIVVEVKTNPRLVHLEPTLVTFHIATAMALVGALVYVTVRAYCLDRAGDVAPAVEPRVARLAVWSSVSVYLLILVGALVRGQHAGLAFPDWPLMDGTVFPSLGEPQATHFLHRLVALEVGVVLGLFAWRARKARTGAVGTFATIAFGLYLAQVVVGGLQVFTKLAPPPVVAHVALSALIWAASIAAWAVVRFRAARAKAEGSPAEAAPKAGLKDTIKAYVALTKPRIILLLLITTVPTMMLAEGGMPSLWLMTATVLGGAIAAGAANTMNMYFDRDIDSVMRRTRNRPLPAHTVPPVRALKFGGVLAAISFFFMATTVNTLAAMLTQAAIAFYVIVYTLGLKRHTAQNIVIGGAAGAVPVLVGWAAVTGRVEWPAVVAFSVIFFWTPAHFWALAMRYSRDYEAAGVPMMPVVAGARSTQRQIFVYAAITVAVTLLLWPVAHMGTIYLGAATLLGVWLMRHAARLLRHGTPAAAMGLFKFSISYLALLFAAMGVDALIVGA